MKMSQQASDAPDNMTTRFTPYYEARPKRAWDESGPWQLLYREKRGRGARLIDVFEDEAAALAAKARREGSAPD